jgi:hypothetical protein
MVHVKKILTGTPGVGWNDSLTWNSWGSCLSSCGWSMLKGNQSWNVGGIRAIHQKKCFCFVPCCFVPCWRSWGVWCQEKELGGYAQLSQKKVFCSMLRFLWWIVLSALYCLRAWWMYVPWKQDPRFLGGQFFPCQNVTNDHFWEQSLTRKSHNHFGIGAGSHFGGPW